MLGRGNSSVNHDFNAYNAADQIWNGSAFVAKVAANYATYRVAATKISDVNDVLIDEWFAATDVPGAVRYELLERGATLADSIVVWAGDDVQDEIKKIHRSATAVTAGGPVQKHLETALGVTLQTVNEVIDGDTP